MSMFDELLASEVKYCGFVYIDSTDERPTLYHANVAAMMFDKKQLKATRALNPLFALENDKSLEMIVIQESLKMFAKKEGQTILEVPIRKVVCLWFSPAVAANRFIGVLCGSWCLLQRKKSTSMSSLIGPAPESIIVTDSSSKTRPSARRCRSA
eukprot:m.61958 g.61958  ORF g.61958 m.61958 type:complete len:154 (+) comp49513_c0_seq3:220-681(+)